MSTRFSGTRVIFICIVIMAVIFTGCTAYRSSSGNKTEPVSTGDSKNELQGTTLKFWMRAASKNSVTGSLIDKYNEENSDNAIIEFEVFGENYKNVIQMALAAKQPPDVFELNGGLTITQLAQSGSILPIDNYVTEEFKNCFYPEVFTQKQFYYEGKLYTIPERVSFYRLIYNTDLFAKAGLSEPPETLEQMKEYAQKITEMGEGKYFGFVAALKTASSWLRFTDNICTTSGQLGESGFDWETGKFDFFKQKKALEYLISLDREGIMAPDSLLLDIEVSRAQFGQGKYAMMIDGNWQVAQFGNNEIKCDVNWDSAPIPVFEGDKRGKSYMSFDMGKVIAEESKYPKEAWNFIRYLFMHQSEFVKSGEPLRTTIQANAKENIPQNYMGIKNFTDIENSIAFPLQVHNFLNNLEGDSVEIVYESIFAGGTPMNEGLASLTDRYNKALNNALSDGSINEKDILIPEFEYFNYYNLTQ